MAQKGGSSYPSPNAAQTGNGAGPYPGPQSSAEPEDMDLDSQLRREIEQTNASAIDQNAGQPAVTRADQAFVPQHMYHPQAYAHMGLAGAQLGVQPVAPAGPIPNPPPVDESLKKTKLSKASRACDECRRKKIKCDADTDSSTLQPCSNCRRTNSENCKFSRTPMKRGPSKGYIKELSDRVANLESERGKAELHPKSASPSALNETFNGSRKRTHSVSEAQSQEPLTTPLQNPSGSWGLQSVYPHNQKSPYANMGQSQSIPGGLNGLPVSAKMLEGQLKPGSWSEEEDHTTENYYQIIHAQLPLLPSNKKEIATMVQACPGPLRVAFFRAMSTCTSLLPRSRQCKEIRHTLEHEVASSPELHSPTANIIYLQTLIFLIIATELDGPVSMKPLDAPTKDQFFGMARGITSHLKLHSPDPVNPTTAEAKLVHMTGRRAWWILATLDSWNALGSGNQPQIISKGTHPVNDDWNTLGNTLYFFACLSSTSLGLSSALLHNPPGERDPDMVHEMLSNNLSTIENSRVDPYDSEVFAPLGHAAILHYKLLVLRYRMRGTPRAADPALLAMTIQQAKRIIDGACHPRFPLAHHIHALAARTLLELVDSATATAAAGVYEPNSPDARMAIQQTNVDDALELLRSMAQLLERQKGGAGVAPDEAGAYNGWMESVRRTIEARLAAKEAGESLRELADAAVGAGGVEGEKNAGKEGGKNKEGEKHGEKSTETAKPGFRDWGTLGMEGYLVGLE